MSFDTTSGNTGHLNGACTLLEKKMGRELLWLACRHHVMELILLKVFTLCCGPSSAPDIPILSASELSGQALCTTITAFWILRKVVEISSSPLQFLTEVLGSGRQIRDDYQELIELTIGHFRFSTTSNPLEISRTGSPCQMDGKTALRHEDLSLPRSERCLSADQG